jgi:ionotropic kainate glutamate receptor 2
MFTGLHFSLFLQDIETFDLEDFKYNSVNITAFRLVDVEDTRVVGTLEQMERFQPIGHAILNRSGIIQVDIKTYKKPTGNHKRKATPSIVY